MAEGSKSGTGSLIVFGVAVLVNLVLSFFLLDQVARTRQDVADLSAKLASKQDVAMLQPIRVGEILEDCQRCHTKRRFSKLKNMTQSQVLSTIQRMRSHPGADIAEGEVSRIEAALLLFRCTACHGDEVLSLLGLMPPDERLHFLRAKVAMPNSGFRPDQVGQLMEAFDILARQSAR